MKRNGAYDLFRLHDIRRHPLFYIEMLYVFFTLLGVGLLFAHGIADVDTPPGTSPAWQAAASYIGILALLVVAVVVCGIGVYGLFWGGFKWRARHMFGQFLLRLYALVGTLSIHGLYPTSWVASALLTAIAALIYLRLRWEGERWKTFVEDA